jgi:hypothetical protein
MRLAIGYDHTGNPDNPTHPDVQVSPPIEGPPLTAPQYADLIRAGAPGINPEVIFVVSQQPGQAQLDVTTFRRGKDYPVAGGGARRA